MGMFDYVYCDAELPAVDGWTPPQGFEFQTKDLDNTMTRYKITAYGRLVKEVIEYEDNPDYDPNEEFAADDWFGRLQHIGQMMREKSRAWVDIEHHGYLTFYGGQDTGEVRVTEVPGREAPLVSKVYKWIDYRAKFTDGQLVEVKGRGEHGGTWT